MQHLKEKWLKLCNYYYILYSVGMLAVYVFFAIQQGTPFIKNVDAFGSNLLVAILSLMSLIYSFFFLNYVKRYSIWVAYTVGFAFWCFINSIAVEMALGTAGAPFFLINSYLTTITSALLGPLAALTIMGFNITMHAMVIAGNIPAATYLGVTYDTIVLIIRMIIGIGLLLLFRDKYVSDSFNNKEHYIERYFVNNAVVNLLTNSISDGVIIIDNNQVIQSINPTALQLVNRTERDVLELNYRSVLKFKQLNGSDLAPEKEPVGVAMQTNQSVIEELILTVEGKPEIYVDVAVSAMVEPQTKDLYGAVIILRDVSKKKKEEQERSEFVSTASHEMRTPIAAIEGYLGLALNERVSTIDDKARTYLQKAHESTQHLGRLFQDLLMSAKAEDGRLSNHPQVVEIGELIEQQVEMYKLAAQKKNLNIEFITGSNASGVTKHETLKVIKPLYYAHVDPDRIREIFVNLLDNAIKYTERGKVTVGLTGDKSVVQFFVKDTGVGIAQEDIPHLFQKFYRVDSSATRTTGGTGLGLFLCRKLLDLYHGRIWVESKQGEGSTFYVNLPRLNTSQAQVLQSRAVTDNAAPNNIAVK